MARVALHWILPLPGAAVATVLSAAVALGDTPSPSPAADSTSTTVAGAAFGGASWLGFAIVLLLAFGLAVLWSVLYYLNQTEGRYYGVIAAIARRGGEIPDATDTPAVANGMRDLAVAPKPPTIGGPSAAGVGSETTYSVTNPEAQATWSAEPNDAAAVNPMPGDKVVITPAKVGVVTLKHGTASKQVAAVASVAPPAQKPRLPFVGSGWGSITVAIVVADLAAVLLMAGKLDGAVVATLFGTLLGYLFGAKPGATAADASASPAPSDSTA